MQKLKTCHIVWALGTKDLRRRVLKKWGKERCIEFIKQGQMLFGMHVYQKQNQTKSLDIFGMSILF